MVCALDKVGVLPGGRVLGTLGAPQQQIRGERLGRDESDERGRSSLVRLRLYPSYCASRLRGAATSSVLCRGASTLWPRGASTLPRKVPACAAGANRPDASPAADSF